MALTTVICDNFIASTLSSSIQPVFIILYASYLIVNISKSPLTELSVHYLFNNKLITIFRNKLCFY
jgi:hypothetical protein